jgi:hypothetical protein
VVVCPRWTGSSSEKNSSGDGGSGARDEMRVRERVKWREREILNALDQQRRVKEACTALATTAAMWRPGRAWQRRGDVERAEESQRRGARAGMDARSTAAARVMCRSKGFVLVDNKLYRRGARSRVLMKCVTGEDGYDILREIHEGVCGNHTASRTLVGKAYRAGFWWPTAVSDAEDLVWRCQNCQFFGKQSHIPAHNLITILPSWPFACWSLDMIGPFITVPGCFTHVLVPIDKFTK